MIKNLSIIVAMSKNRVIGKDNGMPWHLSDDLKNFKKLTTGKTIIMGRLTYNSIGKPLPDRKNIVLSRNLKDERVIVTDNLNESLEKFKHEKEVFIIGGEDIYRQTISLINKLYLTTIEDVIEGDKYFPVIDISKWELIEKTIYKKDESNSHNFKTEIYVKNF